MNLRTKNRKCMQLMQRGIGALRRCWHSFWSFCTRQTRLVVFGQQPQVPQAIITVGLPKVLWHCKIHILPILCTVILSYFNLAGYFIGDTYMGLAQTIYQDLDALCLQIAAKLMEVIVVSSTTIMVMDLLREALLRRPKGLPFGLLSAGFRFSDLTYFWTPDFLWGGFASGRVVLSAAVVVAGLLAVFTGPSSALLMIPTRFTNWPAGGASFYLSGSVEDLWPDNLTSVSTGISSCQEPSKEMIEGLWLNMSSCVWNGYPLIAQAFRALHFNTYDNQIEMTDGVVKRMLSVQMKGRVPDTWALAIDMSTGAYSSELASVWYNMALFEAPLAQTRYHNFRYRERNSTMTIVRSTVPAVRTNCNLYENVSFLSSFQPAYPMQPEYQPASTTKGFNLPPPTGYNSSRVTTRWRTISDDSPVGVNVDSQGNWVSGFPSVFLDVQIPYQGQSSTGLFVSCSIDARWTVGDVVGTNIGYQQGTPVQQASVPSQSGLVANFPTVDNGMWRAVRLEQSWLDTLAPVLDDVTPQWTTLSSGISSTGADNSSGLVIEYADIVSSVEGVIASLVVDGMSRVGYVGNGGKYTHITDIEYLFYIPTDDGGRSLNELLSGTLTLPFSGSKSQFTPLRWDVIITGLAYKANSTSYYLSLAVLYVHACFALLHTIYSLWHRRTSSAWESLTDLVLLCLNSSPASAQLQNATGGINEHALYKKRTWIRGVKSNPTLPTPTGVPTVSQSTTIPGATLQQPGKGSSSTANLSHVTSRDTQSKQGVPNTQEEVKELQLIVGEYNDLAPQNGYEQVQEDALYKTVIGKKSAI